MDTPNRKETTENILRSVRERVENINTIYGRNELNKGHLAAADSLKTATEMFADADSDVVLQYIHDTYKRVMAMIMADTLPDGKAEYNVEEIVDVVQRTAFFVGMSMFFDGYFYREIQEEQRATVSP